MNREADETYFDEMMHCYRKAGLLSSSSLTVRLRPFITVVRRLDLERRRLETAGGDAASLQRITDLLRQSFILEDPFRSGRGCTLDQPDLLREAIRACSGGTVDLDIETSHAGFPLYYCFRVIPCEDTKIIVEDYHRSPGFALHDPRFHQRHTIDGVSYLMRLSGLRVSCGKTIGSHDPDHIDHTVRLLAALIYRHAWSEYQYPARQLSDVLGLHAFPGILECLQLARSTDLCRLRDQLDETLLALVRESSGNSFLYRFIVSLTQMDGHRITAVQTEANELRDAMLLAYTELLRTEFAVSGYRVSLWKTLYSNCPHLESFSDFLHNTTAVRKTANMIETTALDIADTLTCTSLTQPANSDSQDS